MAPKPKPETPAPEAPLPLPSSGGAWIRLPDGTLIRDPDEHPERPVEPALKEV